MRWLVNYYPGRQIRASNIRHGASAQARGRKVGRPEALIRKQAEQALKLYQGRNHSRREICALLKISKPTLSEYLRRNQVKLSVTKK